MVSSSLGRRHRWLWLQLITAAALTTSAIAPSAAVASPTGSTGSVGNGSSGVRPPKMFGYAKGPVEHFGTAAGRAHHVPASATRTHLAPRTKGHRTPNLHLAPPAVGTPKRVKVGRPRMAPGHEIVRHEIVRRQPARPTPPRPKLVRRQPVPPVAPGKKRSTGTVTPA